MMNNKNVMIFLTFIITVCLGVEVYFNSYEGIFYAILRMLLLISCSLLGSLVIVIGLAEWIRIEEEKLKVKQQ